MKIRLIMLAVVLFSSLAPCLAQGSVPYQRLLVLIAGPSGDRIDPTEQAVVNHLNQLRWQHQFSKLQMGTMHFDRPAEAALLKNTLGMSPQAGVTVALVYLSEQGMPSRTLYKMENVTASRLQETQERLLTQWAQVSGEALPRSLERATGGPPPRTPVPPTASSPSGSSQQTAEQDEWVTYSDRYPEEERGEFLTPEGIKNVVNALHQRSNALWEQLRRAPMRDDRKDEEVRRQTLGLTETALNLKAANDGGLIYPREQLRRVIEVGRAWEASEPQYYLPVPLRQEVAPMKRLLKQVRDIERQAIELEQSSGRR